MPAPEYLRSISIGQYIPRDSILHRMTPGTKFELFILLTLLCLLASTFSGLLATFLFLLFLAILSRIPLLFLARGLVPALPFFLIAGLSRVLFAWPGDNSRVLLVLGPVSLTLDEMKGAILLLVRSSELLLAASFFTAITPESQIACGLEDVLAPLKRVGFKPARIALAVTTAFRFVPIVAGEIETIVRAQSCRGADFGGRKRGILARARAWLPLFVPVIVRSLERATTLALAMESRGYREEGRSRYRTYLPVPGEVFFRAACLLFVIALLALEAVL